MFARNHSLASSIIGLYLSSSFVLALAEILSDKSFKVNVANLYFSFPHFSNLSGFITASFQGIVTSIKSNVSSVFSLFFLFTIVQNIRSSFALAPVHDIREFSWN
jgi:hypothetical protein